MADVLDEHQALTEATLTWLHPTPLLRWWIRAGRQLVPRGRRQPAIAATVPTQRAGDDTAAGAPALPIAPTP